MASGTVRDRWGLAALFWSHVSPYVTFRLDMDELLDLGLVASVPCPRSAEAAAVAC
ncbi:hypothetical protein [Streptomyces sp. NPDC002403]